MENTDDIMYVLVIHGTYYEVEKVEICKDYNDIETRICDFTEQYGDNMHFKIYQTTCLPWREGEARYTPNITYFDQPQE